MFSQMELELTSGRDRLATLTDEKCRLEDEVSMLHNSQMTLQSHMHQYQVAAGGGDTRVASHYAETRCIKL